MDLFIASLLFLGVLAATLAATYAVLRILQKRTLFDHPNPRSSHTSPTPRGGGIAIVAILVPAWALIGLSGTGNGPEVWTVAVSALGLAGLSWLDDMGGLPPLVRLSGQAVAVAATLSVMQGYEMFFAGLLPPALDIFLAGVLWVWFINLFNFMDGIDGIAGTEAVCIGLGVTGVALAVGLGQTFPLYGLAIAAAALGFLWWNWQPAKVFMGDVGSIPLGYLLGWLLLGLAGQGQWAPALILPLYYLADATVTLVRRGLRGETVWRAHREHFYQKMSQRGFSHAFVVITILTANLALIALAALAASGRPGQAIIGACAVVTGLLAFMATRKSPTET